METPLWYEHPKLGDQADVVALQLSIPPQVVCYPYLLNDKDEIAIGPSEIISVIGFPFGKTAEGRFAIWVTGFMASEPDIHYEEMPKFLIDCRTRPGQSGSPVVAYKQSGAKPMADGSIVLGGKPIVNLLGIYSGRINEESDLGIVWKTEVITEIVTSL